MKTALICHHKKTLFAAIVWLGCSAPSFGQKTPAEFNFPITDGLSLLAVAWSVLPESASGGLFRFADGRLVIQVEKGSDIWSQDNGQTWQEGPKGPAGKTVFEPRPGEILAMALGTGPHKDGYHELKTVRSTDNWATTKTEMVRVDVPEAGAMGTDDGRINDGMRVHHGMVRLKNGALLMTLYGNYQGDTEMAGAYPPEFNVRKYRTVVVTSWDNGYSWGEPVTVAYQKMLARGLDPDSSKISYRTVPAITQEGFCEADLTRAPNGDLVCAMRTGGRLPVGFARIFSTPLYVSLSSDEGKTWSPPHQVADRGVCPYLVTLENGLIVCTYGRPGSFVSFSDDHGKTWKGNFQIFPAKGGYNKIVAVGPDRFLGIWVGPGRVFYAITFQVTKKT